MFKSGMHTSLLRSFSRSPFWLDTLVFARFHDSRPMIVTTGNSVEGNAIVVESEPVTVETIGGIAASTAVLKMPRKSTTAETVDAGENRLSCVAAALKVLGESTESIASPERR